MVVRYAFLWSHEALMGRPEASKDRPCVVVIAAARQPDGRTRVRVVPITRTPKSQDRGIALPDRIRRHLGLDADESWVVFDEANDFDWPGPDLRPMSRRQVGVWSYGFLPVEFFDALRQRLAATVRQRVGRRGE
jgi:mRNA-degrading endonuclease toxin of MazEF toxin-antitoxin module